MRSVDTNPRLNAIIREYDANGTTNASNPVEYKEQLGNLFLFNLNDSTRSCGRWARRRNFTIPTSSP